VSSVGRTSRRPTSTTATSTSRRRAVAITANGGHVFFTHELYATDYEGALTFHRDAFGWTLTVMSDSEDFRMSTFSVGGDPLAGTQLDSVNDSPFGRVSRLADSTGAPLAIIQVM